MASDGYGIGASRLFHTIAWTLRGKRSHRGVYLTDSARLKVFLVVGEHIEMRLSTISVQISVGSDGLRVLGAGEVKTQLVVSDSTPESTLRCSRH